jgi:hypothetical protein
MQVPNPFNLDLSFFTATASASASPDLLRQALANFSSVPGVHPGRPCMHDTPAPTAGTTR